MRALEGLIVMLAVSSADAAPKALVGDVHYDFVDQNGFGWATVSGKVTVALTFAGKTGSLTISGKRRWVDGQLKAGPTPGGAPGMDTSNKWEGDVDETIPLLDVIRTKTATTFKLEPGHDKLTGSCSPTKVNGVATTTLYECTITGFKWRTIAHLAELHHPIVLDANIKAKTRILNTMSGKSKTGFGQRVVSRPKPVAKP